MMRDDLGLWLLAGAVAASFILFWLIMSGFFW